MAFCPAKADRSPPNANRSPAVQSSGGLHFDLLPLPPPEPLAVAGAPWPRPTRGLGVTRANHLMRQRRALDRRWTPERALCSAEFSQLPTNSPESTLWSLDAPTRLRAEASQKLRAGVRFPVQRLRSPLVPVAFRGSGAFWFCLICGFCGLPLAPAPRVQGPRPGKREGCATETHRRLEGLTGSNFSCVDCFAPAGPACRFRSRTTPGCWHRPCGYGFRTVPLWRGRSSSPARRPYR